VILVKKAMTPEEAERRIRSKFPNSKIIPPVTRFKNLIIFIICNSDYDGYEVCDGHYSVDPKGNVEAFLVPEHPDYTIENIEFISQRQR
jgi:hypothetical protein